MGLTIKSSLGFGKKTATAGTVIQHLVQPRKQLTAKVMKLKYTAGTTAHTLTAMQSLGKTTLSAAAAGAQAVVNLTAQPKAGNDVAANDFMVLELDDGTYQLLKVSSVATLAITFTANLSSAASKGARIWFFGVVGDSHPQFAAAASATTTLEDGSVGVVGALKQDEPLIIDSDNATAAGTIDTMTVGYAMEGVY